jgi:hemolysin III
MEKNMKLKDRELPKYSLGEELMSAISHGAGALLAIAALVVGIVFSVMYNDVWCVVSMAIYGSTLIVLYTMSTMYHSLTAKTPKKVFRIIDHCAIFLLIAGTETPLTLVTLRGPLGWTIFGVVWAAAALGITLNAIDLKKFDKFSMVCYMAMGFAIMIAIVPLFKKLGVGGIVLLLSGGLAYIIGSVIYYGLGRRKKYFHSVFHLFVLAGSYLHFFCILFYVVMAK